MDGIEILNQVDVLTFNTSCIMYLAVLGFAWLLLLIFSTLESDLKLPWYIASVILVLSIIGVSVFGKTQPTGRYQYEVTIDDSVSFTELYEKYEVIEQKGKIWILEDKEE